MQSNSFQINKIGDYLFEYFCILSVIITNCVYIYTSHMYELLRHICARIQAQSWYISLRVHIYQVCDWCANQNMLYTCHTFCWCSIRNSDQWIQIFYIHLFVELLGNEQSAPLSTSLGMFLHVLVRLLYPLPPTLEINLC